MTKLNVNAKFLIVIHSLHSIIELFISTFLVAYFLHITDNNVVPASLFFIFTYILSGLSFVALGPLIKKGNKLLLFRFSFIVNALILLAIIHLKEQVTLYVWFLGVATGIEKALFFFPQNMITAQENPGNAIISFNGYRYGWNGAIRIIAPLIFGWFITKDSFIHTASFVVLLTLAEFIFSYFLKLSPFKSKPFRFKSLIALAVRRKTIALSLRAEFLRGVVFDPLDLLVVLYTVYMFKTNLNLGILTSVFSLFSIIISFVFARFVRFSSFMRILTFAAIFTFAGTVYFVLDVSKFSFILYNFVFATAAHLVRMIIDINFYKVSQNKSVTSIYRAEFMAVREVFLNVGRVIGFSLITAVAFFEHFEVLKYLILIFSVLIILIGYTSIVLSKRLQAKAL